jgi:hypothetical protein
VTFAPRGWPPLSLVLAYVALVLGVDTLAFLGVREPFDWTIFRWSLGEDFDLFKFFFWLVLPLACCFRSLDRGWFGVARWRRIDVAILALIVLAGAAAMWLVPRVPELRTVYLPMSLLPAAEKPALALAHLTWTISWLPGWEFLLRYALLGALVLRWPRYGWLLVPVIEGVYHLQKPLLEAGAAVLLSLVLTRWAIVRRNGLLPLVAHFLIEIELLLALLLIESPMPQLLP